MATIKIEKRENLNQLGDLLQLLYEDVLLPCESDNKITIKNNSKDKRWVQFIKSNELELIHNHDEEKGKFNLHKKDNRFHLYINSKYASSDICDKIVFTAKQNHLLSSLLYHIRNAFAHNQIFVNKNNNYIKMYDRLSPTSKKFTMIAYLKISTLKKLILLIHNL